MFIRIILYKVGRFFSEIELLLLVLLSKTSSAEVFVSNLEITNYIPIMNIKTLVKICFVVKINLVMYKLQFQVQN
jgi:hypothetical protein